MSCNVFLSVSFSNHWFSLTKSLLRNFESCIKFEFSTFSSPLNANPCRPRNYSVSKILMRHFLFSFMPAFIDSFGISIALPQCEIVTSELSAERWHFDFWWTLKAVVALLQLWKPTERNVSSLLFSMVSFEARFLQMKHATLSFTSLKSNQWCSENHWGWQERFWLP